MMRIKSGTIILILFSIFGQLSAQRMVCSVYERQTFLSLPEHYTDSSIWKFGNFSTLIHRSTSTMICPENNAILMKTMYGTSKDQAYITQLSVNSNGEVTGSSRIDVRNNTVHILEIITQNDSTYVVKEYSQDKILLKKHLQTQTTVCKSKYLDLIDKFEFDSKSIICRRSLNYKKYNNTGSLIIEYEGYGASDSVLDDYYKEIRYDWDGQNMIRKRTRDRYSYKKDYILDSFVYNASGQLIKSIFWNPDNRSGNLKLYNYLNGNLDNINIFHITLLAGEYTASFLIGIDSLKYFNNDLVSSTRYSFDSTTIDFITTYSYFNHRLIKEMFIYQGTDTWSINSMNYNNCGLLLDSSMYFIENDTLKLQQQFTRSYDINCHLVNASYYIPGQLLDKWRYYYEPFQVEIPEADYNYGLVVSPNPANKILKFKTDKYLSTVKVTILNALGQQVKNFDHFNFGNEFTINTESLDPGIYFYIFTTDKERSIGKFIKE